MAGVSGKLLDVVRAIVEALIEPTRYYAHIRYRVQLQQGDRLALQIVRPKRDFPDILPISLMCGAPGAGGDPALGSEVLVVFADGDPNLPVVTHFERPERPGFVPVTATLDASELVRVGESADLVELGSGSEALLTTQEVGRVIRYGDTVLLSGPITAGVAGTAQGVLTLPAPGGSVAKVKAG